MLLRTNVSDVLNGTNHAKKIALFPNFQAHFSSLVVGLMCSVAFFLSLMLVLCGCSWLEMLCCWAVCVPLLLCFCPVRSLQQLTVWLHAFALECSHRRTKWDCVLHTVHYILMMNSEMLSKGLCLSQFSC